MANEDATHNGGSYLGGEAELMSITARFYNRLYGFAVSLTRSEADAADLVQQTFLILTQRLHQIRDFSQIRCWLFTTLRRELLRTIRRRTKHFEVEFLPDIHDPLTWDPEPWRSLDARTVRNALLCLNEPYKATLKLFYLNEFSYREIAESLEIPIGTVMSRLSRGKEQLRSIVEKGEKTTGKQPE